MVDGARYAIYYQTARTSLFSQPIRLLINCAISSSALARMIRIIITSITPRRAAIFAVQSEFAARRAMRRTMANGESRAPLFFHGLLAGSRGLYPSNAISSYCFASPAKLRRLTRPLSGSFMHTFKYRPSRKLPVHLRTQREILYFSHGERVATLQKYRHLSTRRVFRIIRTFRTINELGQMNVKLGNPKF